MFKKIITFSVDRPKIIMAIFILIVVASLTQFPKITIDTDPENMLSEDEFVRVFHHQVKREFGLYDFIVLGIINEKHPEGVFNVSTLNKIYAVTDKVKSIDGVIEREIIAPSTKDNIRQGAIGEVIFEWLMNNPISTKGEALFIRDEAMDNPMFKGTIVSEDAKALCIYVPIEEKNQSYRISQEIFSILEEYQGNEKYYITGLPVAEDTFGVEMFKQMAVSAPLAGLIIFILMLIFFRKLSFVLSPMLLAMGTIIIAMGLLAGFKFPVHIMSSMIPIFLMPIAVLDSVHILSEFFDRYPYIGRKRDTIIIVMDELFKPMLFTSLTSAVGFFSLAFAPIPPVQAFGVFVGIGIMTAWFMTITFIPAYLSLINETGLKNFGIQKEGGNVRSNALERRLAGIGRFSYKRYKVVLLVSLFLILISIYGISKIQVNDNPVRWFSKKHEIRIADKVLNDHFGGTYTAYLVLEADKSIKDPFKEPVMLRYIEGLQSYLTEGGYVGKSTSLADVVKKVYYELLGGDRVNNVIPDTRQAVSQCLISYESSHKPDDLWHFTTPSYDKLNLWLQLKSGDNKNTKKLIDSVDFYIKEHAPPYKLSYNWAGLTYINVIWQNKMVGGMLRSFIGSFIIVFLIMTVLFRSPLRGIISMIPLTVTILFIYSLLGFIGKDYDMPVAVLSALTLGLSIDFAIHFIQRAKDIFAKSESWQQALEHIFQEPARAITRNALVIAIGFLPLLLAPLVPYKTVGFFMFGIMLVSSIATLFILPAIMTAFTQAILSDKKESVVCNCANCIIVSLIISIVIAYALNGYTALGMGYSILIAIATVALLAGACSKVSKASFCIKDKEV